MRVALLLLILVACGEGTRSASGGHEAPAENVIQGEKKAQPAAHAPSTVAPSAPAEPLPATTPGSTLPPAARSCTLASERELPEPAEQVFVRRDRSLAAVLIARDKTNFELLRGASLASLSHAESFSLPEAFASLSLVESSHGPRIVYVDRTGRVLLRTLSAGAAPRVLAQGADRRFAPAFAETGQGELVVFTRSVGEAMHSFMVRADGDKAALDLTPEGHGAAAPAFVLGSGEPRLVMIDARAGMSPLLDLPFAGAKPGPLRIGTPVSQPYAPPLLCAVQLPGDADVQVAYTALGKLAATAVGRVPLHTARAPTALLPSRGYGLIAFDAALGPGRAAFALEAPRSELADAPRGLEVKLLDLDGEGPPLTLATDGPSAKAPSLAAGSSPGEVWLAYTQGGHARLATLHCDW